jgi:hypothetical protein
MMRDEDLFFKLLCRWVCEEKVEDISANGLSLSVGNAVSRICFPGVLDNSMSEGDTLWNHRDFFSLLFQQHDIVEHFFENGLRVEIVYFGIFPDRQLNERFAASTELTGIVVRNEFHGIECSFFADISLCRFDIGKSRSKM